MDRIAQWIEEKAPHQVTTVNPEFVMRARNDHAFRRVINNSDLAVPDGMGLVVAGKLTGRRIRQRVTGADLTEQIALAASQQGWSIFLLGAKKGVAETAAQKLQSRYPKLNIAGTLYSRPGEMDNDEICRIVKNAQPTILLVAYGAPMQDLWISRNQVQLNIPVAIGIGGTFDFIAGTLKRAPRWMGSIGLEWLWRLMQEPWRWRRMLVLPKFAVFALLEGLGLFHA
jgi:N-acetylglucosaminyldiphosphoundecaprenol N-acetyl-beta-D-mannosaminyltransferase